MQNLTNGFFFFCFAEANHVKAILSCGPWLVRFSLLIFKHWAQDFVVFEEKSHRVLVWVVPWAALAMVIFLEVDRLFSRLCGL